MCKHNSFMMSEDLKKKIYTGLVVGSIGECSFDGQITLEDASDEEGCQEEEYLICSGYEYEDKMSCLRRNE